MSALNRALRSMFALSLSLFFLLSPSVVNAGMQPADAEDDRPIAFIDYRHSFGNMEIAGVNSRGNKAKGGIPDPNVPLKNRRFYYLPIFSVEQGNGMPAITVGDNGTVSLTIRYNHPVVREAFFDQLLRGEHLDNTCVETQVDVIPCDRLSFQTNGYEPRVTFGPYEVPAFQAGLEVITTTLPVETARRFADDFRRGNVDLQARLILPTKGEAVNSATLTWDDIQQTDAASSLLGDGKRHEVTRNQVRKIAGEAMSLARIDVRYDYPDASFDKLVGDMLALLKEATPIQLTEGVKSLVEGLRKRGFDPDDLKADLITEFKKRRTENGEYQETFKEFINETFEKSKGVSGGFSFLGIGAHAGIDEKEARTDYRDTFRSVLNRWDIKIEESEQGNVFIPKSMKVYEAEMQKFRNNRGFEIRQAKSISKDHVLTVSVNPRRNFDRELDGMVKEQLEVGRALRRRVADLEKKHDDLSKELHALRQETHEATLATRNNLHDATHGIYAASHQITQSSKVFDLFSDPAKSNFANNGTLMQKLCAKILEQAVVKPPEKK